MNRIAAIALSLLTVGCDVEVRPDLTDAQFKEIIRNCGLPEKVRIEREDRNHPMIVLTGAGVTQTQVECIRAEQTRLGASADMAN